MTDERERSVFADSGGWKVREGMSVYTGDGKELGKVGKVWPESTDEKMQNSDPRSEIGTEEEQDMSLTATDPGFGPSSTLQTGNFASADGVGIPTQGEPQVTGGGGYFKVERGGLLGIGGKDLYIPFASIASVDNAVKLRASSHQVDDQDWTNKPTWLD